MDPNANLTEQLALARRAQQIQDECPDNGDYLPEQIEELARIANRLADLVEALHGWIKKGGFLPALWEVSRAR